MPKIFISYRRQDSAGETTHIYEYLEKQFGRDNVFMDVDTIPPGVDFRQYLQNAVSDCDVVLVVIGPDWLVDRSGNRRLDHPRDFVRTEIEFALHSDIRLIPVLVRDAAMPGSGDLPDSIQDLAFRNAAQVRAGHDFRTDIGRLIRELEAAPPPAAARVMTSAAVSQPNEVTNSIGMKMVLIPAGEFLMGSPDSDPDAQSGEKPQHLVRIMRPFYLGLYPVTQEQYERVMGSNPSHFKGNPNRPVEMVSWNDAQEFCRRASTPPKWEAARHSTSGGLPLPLSAILEEEEDGRYRLPTEAEWEYACRAGSTTRYYFGDSPLSLGDYAWWSRNSDGSTHPAGKKKPNAWGLHDMHGNVWEWCADWYESDYYSQSPPSDPSGPSSGASRVLRGGSWRVLDPGRFRCVNRYSTRPDYRFHCFGFRVARTLTP